MSDTVTSRRKFLKILSASAVALPVLVREEFAHAQGVPTTALSPTDPMAAALGYHEDATKVDAAKYPKRSGAEGAKQNCTSCVLLLQSGLKVAGRTENFGKCGLFQTGLVTANGWCNSWAPKA